MRRITEIAAVGAATAALFAGSVVEATSTYDAPLPAEMVYDQPDTPDIYVGERKLPQDIGRIATSTVEIYGSSKDVHYTDPRGNTLGTLRYGFTGSGTVVKYGNSKVVITAAHVAAGASEHCGDEEVRLPADGRKPFTLKAQAQTPAEATDGNYTMTYNKGRDASVFVPQGDRRFNSFTAMTVQSQVVLNPGDSIFSVGYGPRKNRDPNPVSDKPALQPPIVVPGVVVKSDGNKVEFLTNISPAGDSSDYNGVHHGDSGGTMVDAQGDYLGDVIAIEDEGATYTGRDIEKRYKVDLPQSAEKQMFGIAIGQIIDTTDLREMVAGLELCSTGVPQFDKLVPMGTDISNLPDNLR